MPYLKNLIKHQELSRKEITEVFNVKHSSVSQVESVKDSMPIEWMEILERIYGFESVKDFLVAEEQLKQKSWEEVRSIELIPFYDDLITIGGSDSLANNEPSFQPSDYVGAGDRFKDATNAISHYGENMTEYSTFCKIAIGEVRDKNFLVFGKDNVIGTSEYRIMKRLQSGSSDEFLTAPNSNKETFSDCRQLHQPIFIPLKAVKRIFLKLGYVVK
jgi:transcriptional regulator with XRE-family HTH domain